MRFPLNTRNDDRFIPIVMALRANGFTNYSYEAVIKHLKDVPFLQGGTGWKTKDLKFQRKLYEKDGLIYKLWDKSFQWSENMVEAIRIEFYGPLLTPALLGLIVDDDVDVRGYVMLKCQLCHNAHDWAKAVELINQQQAKTGMTFPDAIRQNVGTYKGKITLFDLENVVYVDG